MNRMKIICFGDSNTFGYDPRGFGGGRYPEEDRWVDILARQTGCTILNEGENGREIPHRLGENDRLSRLLESEERADRLLIMLGTNDLLQGADVDETAGRMERFLTAIPISADRILLIAPPPMIRGAWVGEKRLLTDSKQLAVVYRRVAMQCGTLFADAGEWGIELAFDGVHFTEKGHHSFAVGLYPALCQK